MIEQIFLIISTITIYEYLKIIKLRDKIRININIYQKLINLFKYKKVSDFRKEKLLLNYSNQLFIISFKIIFIFIIIICFLFILNLIQKSFFDLLFSLKGIIEFIIIFFLYNKLKVKLNAQI